MICGYKYERLYTYDLQSCFPAVQNDIAGRCARPLRGDWRDCSPAERAHDR